MLKALWCLERENLIRAPPTKQYRLLRFSKPFLGQFRVVDLPRLHPKAYLELSAGRESLRGGIAGLIAKDRNGIPAGTLLELGNEAGKWNYPLVHTTVVTNVKANGEITSRLCLRCDRIPQNNKHFASAPTVSNDFIRIFCCVFVNHLSFVWTQVDISKAFAQSDRLRDADKMIATPLILFFPMGYRGKSGLRFAKARG